MAFHLESSRPDEKAEIGGKGAEGDLEARGEWERPCFGGHGTALREDVVTPEGKGECDDDERQGVEKGAE